MRFRDLHEALRVEILRRLDLGTLTGSELARLTGFRQAHISNFLHAKRSLSLTGLDRVLTAMNLTVDDLTLPAVPAQLAEIHAVSGASSASASIPDGGSLMESPATANGARRNEDIALDLLKFVAASTGIGRSAGPPTAGFTAPTAAKSEDQVAHLLDLYGRCLKTVQGSAASAR